MSVKLNKHGPVLATMSITKLRGSITKDNRKRNKKVINELAKRGASLEETKE